MGNDRIYSLLTKRYPVNEYVLLEEVRDSAGFNASRSADYIAVNLWPSRGLAINGIELKSFRSDWLSELKKPEKAEKIFQFCDYFWLLTTDDTVAKLDEIPAAWGWLTIKGERILIQKEAPKLEAKPLSRGFVCAMLKRAADKSNWIRQSDIEDRIKEAREAGKNEVDYQTKRFQKEHEDIIKRLQEFKEHSGIDLIRTSYFETPKMIGEAVRIINNGGVESITKQLTSLERTAQNVLTQIKSSLESLNTVNENVKL